MSKAAELAALIGSQSARGYKNRIINGSMDIAQRGSSHTTEGYGSLDRYYLALSGASGVTMSQQAFSTADRNSLGFEKYLKLAVTTANNNCGVYQYIEASNAVSLIGNKATLSFYAKGTNPAGGSFTMQPAWYNKSSGGGDNAVAQSLTVTSSWVKYSFTFDIPAPANTVIDNNAYLSHSFAQPSGDTSTTAWELNLAGLQFEAGEVATPFEHEDIGTTLAKCSRYYTDIVRADNQTAHLVGYVQATTVARFGFHVPMRASPTITETNFNILYAGGSEEAITSVDDIFQDNQFLSFRAVVSGNLTVGQAVALYSAGAARFAFDAEL